MRLGSPGGGKGIRKRTKGLVSYASYMIPNEWVTTEAEAYDKIFNSKIYSDKTGKCYYINRALGGNEPEVFCIFYFDNNVFLERSGDKDRTRDIEKEIINNICPDEEKVWKIGFPTEESTFLKRGGV